MLGIGFVCMLYHLSLISNGFSVLFQHLHRFTSNGLLDHFYAFLEKSLNSQFPIRFSKSKMASSQVEIVSSSPFGCVLRDHNRRDQFSNTQTAFQKNLKDYLLHTCISNSTPDENSMNADENSMNADGWVRNHTTTTSTSTSTTNNNELLSPNSRRHARVLERWAKARETLSSIDRPKEEERENSPTQSNTSVEIPHLGGVSSLVQRWRGFTETRLNQNPKSNNPNVLSMLSSPVLSSRCNSENASLVELPVPPRAPQNDLNDDENPNSLGEAYDESIDERFDTPSMMTEDSFMDWESERTAPSGPPSVQGGRDSTDGGDSERLRVADVIRKLTSENQMQGSLKYWKNEQGASASSSSPRPYEPSLPRLRMMVSDHQAEERSFSSPVVSSPRLRGRQAFNDLLMQLERDRHRELDGLVERRAVSRFSHRGRIQSLLRLKILRREAEARYDHRPWHSRQQAPIRDQQQQHPYSRVVEAQQHSNCEAAVEAPQYSHAAAVRPRLLSCRGGDTNAEPNLCHEEVRSQQHLRCEATVGNQQHSNSATIGTLQHSYSKEVRVLETAGGEAAVANRQQSHPTSSESSRTRQGPAVVLLREIFDIRVENDSSTPRTPRGVVVNNNPDMKISSSNPFIEEPQLRNQNLVSYATKDVHKEASPRSGTQRQGISHEVCNIDSQDSAPERLTISNGWEEDENAGEQEANDQEQTTSNEDRINGDWEEQEASNQQLVRTAQDWTSDVSCPWSEWDEQEANSQQMIETTNDWITDIARPRSDWEGLREARYQEMLDPYLDNEDIRQLLERRSVSTFLSSNLRDTMDQLMISRVERLPQSIGNEQEEEDGFHNRLEQLMLSQMQRQTYPMTSHREDEEHQEDMVEDQEEEDEEDDEQEQIEEGEEEEDENEEEEEGQEEEEEEEEEEKKEDEEEEESPYSEVGDYVDQVEDHARTWSHDGDHEVSDDSDQVASQSSQQPQSSQASYPNTPLCPSFINQSSIEMELIYDLRGHMVQLRQEMSELRKSVKSCVNMQAKLQRSINHEVADAVSLAVRRVGKESLNRVPRKRCCCVCYEMHVDCLLYRCGHMCTCFKCAHELQWSSGKCPICRAPIVDVVRAYANDS